MEHTYVIKVKKKNRTGLWTAMETFRKMVKKEKEVVGGKKD